METPTSVFPRLSPPGLQRALPERCLTLTLTLTLTLILTLTLTLTLPLILP